MRIDEYIMKHSDPEDQVLSELSRETQVKVPRAGMLSGYLQGKLFEFISQMIRPENVLEIGTFTGYSAICWAKGLTENGRVHTVELNEEREPIIRKYIQKADFEKKIQLYIGDAKKIIPRMNISFDLVFIDADKPSYPDYYRLCFEKVKKGGYIIADNVLWHGKVVKTDENDESTEGIKAFNELAANDHRTEKFILPLRDGLMLIRKK